MRCNDIIQWYNEINIFYKSNINEIRERYSFL